MRHPGVSQEESKAYFESPSSTFDVAGRRMAFSAVTDILVTVPENGKILTEMS